MYLFLFLAYWTVCLLIHWRQVAWCLHYGQFEHKFFMKEMMCRLPGIFCSVYNINPEFHLGRVWENEIELLRMFYVDKPAVLTAVVLKKFKQVCLPLWSKILVIWPILRMKLILLSCLSNSQVSFISMWKVLFSNFLSFISFQSTEIILWILYCLTFQLSLQPGCTEIYKEIMIYDLSVLFGPKMITLYPID